MTGDVVARFEGLLMMMMMMMIAVVMMVVMMVLLQTNIKVEKAVGLVAS